MSRSEALVIETFIAAKPDLVFKYFVDAERLARWMGDAADVDPTPGGIFELHVHSKIARGEYRIVDPPIGSSSRGAGLEVNAFARARAR